MKIKSKNPSVASMKLIVPIDGLIEIDKNGVADVSAKCATTLVKGTNDWDYLKGKATATEEELEEEELDEEELEEDEEEGGERSELEAKLADMKLADMKQMATDAGFPSEEFEPITTKKLMAAYLLKKYDETVEADDTEELDEEDEAAE